MKSTTSRPFAQVGVYLEMIYRSYCYSMSSASTHGDFVLFHLTIEESRILHVLLQVCQWH
jgi:hypothetical protein